MSLVTFFVFVNFYTLRVCLSVAILTMVNRTYLPELEATAVNVSSNSSSGLSYEHEPCATDNNSSSHADDYDNVRIRRTLNPVGLFTHRGIRFVSAV